jgi:hypothetical protein
LAYESAITTPAAPSGSGVERGPTRGAQGGGYLAASRHAVIRVVYDMVDHICVAVFACVFSVLLALALGMREPSRTGFIGARARGPSAEGRRAALLPSGFCLLLLCQILRREVESREMQRRPAWRTPARRRRCCQRDSVPDSGRTHALPSASRPDSNGPFGSSAPDGLTSPLHA